MSSNYDRNKVEIAKKRVPLKKLMHGKEIREAMAELEKFRQQFNEHEFLYGGKVYLSFHDGEMMAYVLRPETDKEYEKRIELIRQEEHKKMERQRIRELKAQEAAVRKQQLAEIEAEKLRQEEIKTVREMAKRLGLTVDELLNG